MSTGDWLALASAESFAQWLEANHTAQREVWIVIYKKASGKQTVTFDELLAVALCYGWIDSKTKSVDAAQYAIRFTPRKAGSPWSAYNRKLARELLTAGRMTESGKAVLPADL